MLPLGQNEVSGFLITKGQEKGEQKAKAEESFKEAKSFSHHCIFLFRRETSASAILQSCVSLV